MKFVVFVVHKQKDADRQTDMSLFFFFSSSSSAADGVTTMGAIEPVYHPRLLACVIAQFVPVRINSCFANDCRHVDKPCCVSLWICFWFASMHHVPWWNGFSPYEKLPEKCLPRQNHAASSSCSFWQSKNKRQQSTMTGCKTLTSGMVNGKLSSCCTLAFFAHVRVLHLEWLPLGWQWGSLYFR